MEHNKEELIGFLPQQAQDKLAQHKGLTFDFDLFDRVSANFNFYYQQDGEITLHHAVNFSRGKPGVDEEPFTKRMKVTTEAQPIPLGHLDADSDYSTSHLIIENKAQKDLPKGHKPGDMDKLKDSTIIVSQNGVDILEILPHEFCFFKPLDVYGLTLRASKHDVRAHVVITPYENETLIEE